jgi:hypothetical protein
MEDFLLASKALLRDEEESLVVITQNTSLPFKSWDVAGAAKRVGYRLVAKVPFNTTQYPGYQNRRGFGPNAAKPFNCASACTFTFALDQRSCKKMDLSKGLQSMKDDQLSCSSPLYRRLPTSPSPDQKGEIKLRKSMFHEKKMDDARKARNQRRD